MALQEASSNFGFQSVKTKKGGEETKGGVNRAAWSTLTFCVMTKICLAWICFAVCLTVGCAKQSESVQTPNATPSPSNLAVLSPAEAKVAFASSDGLTKALERRWPLVAIRTYCTPERRHNPSYQNLVAESPVWNGVLYSGESTGFDQIAWYATTKMGRVYQYSLGVNRGNDFWLLEIGDERTLQAPPNYSPEPNKDYFVGHK